ncbi:hypothetical protein [Sutcliffiella deserti]|uniref:hypothetical protein n=1 Tax=Sutcliffiella deserti TaxID=2875501 RepID=UPI001CBD7A41|nr:hypothetical protein [Sutcliffiella deserti]
MAIEKLNQDLIINGSMTVSGGSFNLVSINGKGTINGGVQCNNFKINGACDINGHLKGETGVIRGRASIKEDIFLHNYTVDGRSDLMGGLYTANLLVRGACTIKKEINSESTKIYGKLKLDGSCNTDSFFSEGVIRIGETLKAKNIELNLGNSRSRVNRMEADSIKILKNRKFNGIIGWFLALLTAAGETGSLSVQEIYGKHINVEATNVNHIRGEKVVIGPGCKVELVEYTDSIEISKDAKVKKSLKVTE